MIALAATPRSIPATITPSEAAASEWQAMVIGAGPAGAATSIRLARAGWRVLLIDRHAMPRPKVCGCCLSPRALGELRGLGLCFDAAGCRAGAVPLAAVRFVAAGRAVRMPLPAGATLSREALDTSLVQAAIDAGADWLPHVDVTAIMDSSEPSADASITCRPRAHAGAEEPEAIRLHGRIAIIAAGLADHIRVPLGPAAASQSRRRTHPASRIGAGCTLAHDALDVAAGDLIMAVGRSGYCGIVRLEDGRLDLAAALDRTAVSKAPSIAAAVDSLLREAVGPSTRLAPSFDALAAAEFHATPALTHATPLVAGARAAIFRVGDAAGYVEPFTGEGIGWALASGRILATALLGATCPATAYVEQHARFFASHHRRCGRIAAALRHPAVVGAAIRAARAAPWAAGRLVPLLVGAGRGASP